MQLQKQTAPPEAFARHEVLAILAVLTLLATIIMPALAGSRRSTDGAACANNLRQIGHAYQLWGADHNDDPPYWVPVAQGGVRWDSLAGNAWFQFAAISNQLATPRVLACPSDVQKRVARDFGVSADGGFLSTGYRNNAVSYWINMHSVRFYPGKLLCGDRNLRVDYFTGCAIGIYNVAAIRNPSFGSVMWTNNLHGLWGNLLAYDGQVYAAANYQVLTNALIPWILDSNGEHLVMP